MERKYNVKISTIAKEDIIGIHDYIANELLNPTAADELLGEMLKKIYELVLFPEGAPMFDNERNTRAIKCKNYRIFYNVNREKGVVRILRVRYGRMNISLADVIENENY